MSMDYGPLHGEYDAADKRADFACGCAQLGCLLPFILLAVWFIWGIVTYK
jgi:hypothetical protein